MSDPLALDPGEIRRLGHAAAEWMARYYEALPETRIMPDTTARAIREIFDEPLPEEGTAAAVLFETLERMIVPLSRHNGHPRFFGYVASPGTPVSAVADLAASVINANVTSWRSAPGPTEIERVAVDWIKQMLGYPAGAAGLFVSGGSMANFAGLAAARSFAQPEAMREGLDPARRLTVYVSEETHFSVAKAAGLLGLGQNAARPVRTDAQFRMDLDALEQRIRQDLDAGFVPACVVANAGSVNNGSFDPLTGIAAVARRYGMWMHVDGAYGGFAALAPSARPLFEGIELADSVALDPHKWLYLSMGCGCVLYRDPETARRAFAHQAEYTRPIGWQDDEAFVFWDYGPELSRRFRALAVWMQIKHAGRRALAEAVERNIACAHYFEKLVEAAADFEMLAPVALSIACFRYVPPGWEGDLDALNERILFELQRQGSSYVSNTRVRECFALRACVLNYRTRERHMEELLEDVRKAARVVIEG
jgi:aromatic-L-amino-acid/L-tryptophan decarboxylase